MKKLLIIGNGSIGNSQNKEFYINNHTGNFLKEIDKKHEVLFAQNVVSHSPNNDLQNFEMKKNQISFAGLKSIKKPSTILQLIKLVRQHNFVYLFFPGTLSRIAALLCIIFNKKFALYIRGQYYNQYKIDGIILKKSRFILTVSPHFMDGLHTYCKNVEIIKPMISIKKEDIDFSRKYEKSDKWNLLFVGRIEYRKGIRELIEIAHYLKSKHLNFELNLVGGGDLFYVTQEQVKNTNLDDCIKLHGQISNKHDLMDFYSNADVFVFTSHDEGFPRVLYEAMAFGLPIFTTFVGGIPGRMENNRNCIEIPVKKGNNAAQIILKTIQNTELLKAIGEEGRNTLLKILDGSYLPHEDLFLKNIEK